MVYKAILMLIAAQVFKNKNPIIHCKILRVESTATVDKLHWKFLQWTFMEKMCDLGT